MDEYTQSNHRIVRLYRAGQSIPEIASEYGVAVGVITDDLKNLGVDIRNRGQKPQPWTDYETMYQLYVEQEMSTKKIAKKFDTYSPTISRWLNRHDIETRGRSEALRVHYGTDGIGERRGLSAEKEWRRNVMDRDNHICQDCGNSAKCAHHIVLWSESEEKRYDIDNGVSLCNGCHYKRHDDKDHWFSHLLEYNANK